MNLQMLIVECTLCERFTDESSLAFQVQIFCHNELVNFCGQLFIASRDVNVVSNKSDGQRRRQKQEAFGSVERGESERKVAAVCGLRKSRRFI